MAYYGVRVGRKPGVYVDWKGCNKQVHGYKGAIYKKFSTEQEAIEFVGEQTSVENSGQAIKTDSSGPKVAKPKLLIPEGHVVAYTDGSYDVKEKTYGYGAVLIYPSGEEEEIEGRGDNPELAQLRNVSAELMAATKAISLAISKGYKVIHVHHDYMGVAEWAKGTWQCKVPVTKSYKQFVDEAKKKIDIQFVKVKAHSGDYYNSVADRLAAI